MKKYTIFNTYKNGKALLFIVILIVVLGLFFGIKQSLYNSAQNKIYEDALKLQYSEKYKEAISKYKELDKPYKNSEDNIKRCETMLENDINKINKAYENREIKTRDMANKLKKINNKQVDELNNLLEN